MSRLSNSKDLVKQCASVLSSDKELAVFPLISFAGIVVVTLVFGLAMYLTGTLDRLHVSGPGAADYVILFVYYLTVYFVAIFCGAALVGAAMVRIGGGDPDLRDGFRAAGARAFVILGYSVVSATVGLLLGLISNRGGTTGRAGSAAGRAGWSIVSFLALPVLVMEEAGPLSAIGRSERLLKQTWGEQLIGSGGIGLISGFVIVLIILLGIAFAVVVAETGSAVAVAAAVTIAILAVAVVGVISASLTGIYRAALYSFATTGKPGTMFREDLIKDAFSARPQKPMSFVGRV